MTGLLGPDGKPISSFLNKKAPAPQLGEKFGQLQGPNLQMLNLPGGGVLGLDLSSLTVQDYRDMTDHYQVNSSLAILTFLMHQMEWRIECDNKAQRDFYTEQLQNIWTPLVRAQSQAFWSGYSPNVLQWENDISSRRVVLTKIKDLVPDQCEVNWAEIKGAENTKISLFDGIKRVGAPTIPVSNSYWYPLLMKHNDYSGTKLLRPAFQPWFFSILLHLFANRYYERFGEPTPIGRAPYDDTVKMGGTEMQGNQAMELILHNLRSRGIVVLPNDKTPIGDEANPSFDYTIEYLESQMRGADFERYMTRLDEEISLALFTPILLMRTADVGSYNLGDLHSVIYQWILNAIGADWKFYMDWYILKPMRDFNFGLNADLPRIRFRKMGAQNEELVRDLLRALVAKGAAKPNYEELGEIAGLEITEVQELKGDQADDREDPTQPSQADDQDKENGNRTRRVVAQIRERVSSQVANAFVQNRLSSLEFDPGHRSSLKKTFGNDATARTNRFFDLAETVFDDMVAAEWSTPESFNQAFGSHLDWIVDTVSRDAS